MRPATTTSDVTVHAWIREVLEGRVALPVFQRAYAWKDADILLLLDSIMEGWPVGALIAWRRWHRRQDVATAGSFVFGKHEIAPHSTHRPAMLIDGQQRTAALLDLALGNWCLDLDTGEWRRTDDDLAAHEFPGEAFFHPRSMEWFTRIQGFQDDDPKTTRRRVTAADKARAAVMDCRLPVVNIETNDPAIVRDIFCRLNLAGRAVTAEDLDRAMEWAPEGRSS